MYYLSWIQPILITNRTEQKFLKTKEVNKDIEFVLIGAGLPRTGTMSAQTALEMILPGKCHHMNTVFMCETGRNNQFWPKAMDGNISDEEWKQFIKDEKLSSGVDYPIAYFWKDLVWGMLGVVQDGEEMSVNFFNEWKDEVMNQVTPDRLLVFEVNQGWGPLCQFLGVPEPSVPFPNVNDTAHQQKSLAFMKKTCYGVWATMVAGFASAA